MKNAFTLVELLGVIVILGIIAVLITPVISGTISENRTELSDAQKTLFVDAAKEYVAANAFSMQKKAEDNSFEQCACLTTDDEGKCADNAFCCEITLNMLKNDGYLDMQEFKDIKDKSVIGDDNFVNVSFDGTIYSYAYNESCEG